MDFSDKVVYQIYIKSFKDSNGDGIGDLRGITEKLDYLKTLAVDYLWLTPFFTSPLNDNGYDVRDYLSIDPIFGTMEDLDELVAKAETQGIGLILDMVFNHTSTEHKWFQRALAGDPEYLDYYIFKDGTVDTPPTNWISKFGGPAWEYVPHLNKWYLHLFDVTQADLNWENPRVREELKQVIRFWKQKGIKGFRFDVVNLISKPELLENDFVGDGRRFYTDGKRVHEYLKELVRDTQIDDMLTAGEMSSTSVANCIRYSNPDEKELSMCFNFHHLKVDYKDGEKWELMAPDIGQLKALLTEWQLGMQEYGGWNAVFWCNHDQPRAVSRFGDDQRYRLESAKLLAICGHLLRGTPYIYQGEELGMTNAGYPDISYYRDVESLNYYQILLAQGKSSAQALAVLGARSRDNARTPMQWSDEIYAGFSETEPWILPPDNYKDINVRAALADENSIFWFYRKLIRLRKEKKAVSEGRISFIYPEQQDAFAFLRTAPAEELMILCNFSNRELSWPAGRDMSKYQKLLGNYEGSLISAEQIILRPYEGVVLEHI